MMNAAQNLCAILIHVSSRLVGGLSSRYRLRAVLLAYVVLPLTAAFGLLWFLALLQFEKVSEQRMQEEIELVARAMQIPLSRALDGGSNDQLQQSLESALAIDRVYGAYVYDQAGDLVLAVGRQPESRQPKIREIAADGNRAGEYGEVAGRRIYSYFVPLSDVGGRVNGVLQVTRRRRDFDDHFSALRQQALVALALGAGLMIAVTMWGHHHALGKHVQRLARDMQRVAQGERRHRSVLHGPEEVSTLASALNTMLDSIEQSERKLTEQQRVQVALEQRLHQAEKLAAIGGLAAGVAHELGTPLSVVDGQAQRLQRDSTLAARSSRAVQQIRAQVRRMELIVRQLLAFGSNRSIEPRPVKVGEVVARACDTLADFARTNGVLLVKQIEGHDVVMVVDAAGLEQAITNLVRNAVQAAPGGEIQVRTRADSGAVRITVDDNGAGVPQEIRARIFEPFFTTKPVGKGTGLGLALAHRTIQDMGGTIDLVASELGGAGFEICLPQNKHPTAEAL
jgi:signal transduction histidine kinase